MIGPSDLEAFAAETSKDKEMAKPTDPKELDRIRRLIRRLHIIGGHASKTNIKLLLRRRGCPAWQQDMVDELECDACQEEMLPEGPSEVSVSAPPKIWQADKADAFELEGGSRKAFSMVLVSDSRRRI